MLASEDSQFEPYWISTQVTPFEFKSDCCFGVTVTSSRQISWVRLLIVHHAVWSPFDEAHFDLCPHLERIEEIPPSKAQCRRLRPVSWREESCHLEQSKFAGLTIVLKMDYSIYGLDSFDLLPFSPKDDRGGKWRIALDCTSPATQLNPFKFYFRGVALVADRYCFPAGNIRIHIHPRKYQPSPNATNLPPRVIKTILRMGALRYPTYRDFDMSTMSEVLKHGLVCKAWLVAREVFFEFFGQFRVWHINVRALSEFLDRHPELLNLITSVDTELFIATFATSPPIQDPSQCKSRQAIASIIARSPRLKTLQTSASFIPLLKNVFPQLSLLTSLAVYFHGWFDPPCKKFDDFFGIINTATNLQELRLVGLQYLDAESHKPLALPPTIRLRSLHVERAWIQGPVLLALISSPSGHLRTLRLQSLESSGLCNRDLRLALSAISHSLETLWLCDFQLTPALEYQERHALEAVLPQMNVLNELYVWRQRLTPSIIARKSQTEGTSPRVEIVDDGTDIFWDEKTDTNLADAMEMTGWTSISIRNWTNFRHEDVNGEPVRLLVKQANEVALRRGIKFMFADEGGEWEF